MLLWRWTVECELKAGERTEVSVNEVLRHGDERREYVAGRGNVRRAVVGGARIGRGAVVCRGRENA